MPPSHVLALDAEQLLTNRVTARAIRHKARQLAGRAGFSLSEQEDLEQEFRLHLLRRLPKFDPRIAHWNVFVRTLLERYAATLIAERRARLQASAGLVEEAEAQEARVDIALDTAELVARLPRKARTLCERLKAASVADVARQMNVPRRTLRDQIERLREHFIACGLTLYAESVRHFGLEAGR